MPITSCCKVINNQAALNMALTAATGVTGAMTSVSASASIKRTRREACMEPSTGAVISTPPTRVKVQK